MIGAVERDRVGSQSEAAAAIVHWQQLDLAANHANAEHVRPAPRMQRLPLKYQHTGRLAPARRAVLHLHPHARHPFSWTSLAPIFASQENQGDSIGIIEGSQNRSPCMAGPQVLAMQIESAERYWRGSAIIPPCGAAFCGLNCCGHSLIQ